MREATPEEHAAECFSYKMLSENQTNESCSVSRFSYEGFIAGIKRARENTSVGSVKEK